MEIGPPASLEFYNVSLEPFQLRVQQVREISRSGAQFTFQRDEVERVFDGISASSRAFRANSRPRTYALLLLELRELREPRNYAISAEICTLEIAPRPTTYPPPKNF